LDQLRRLGLHLDLTIGPSFPAMIPGLLPTHPGAAKELVHGLTILQPGEAYDGPLPLPTSRPAGMSPANVGIECGLKVVGVHLVPVKEGDGSLVVQGMDQGFLDVTPRVQDGGISVETPNGSTKYALVASYYRGTAQVNPPGEVMRGRGELTTHATNRRRPYSSRTT
jgi:hypothetical protein